MDPKRKDVLDSILDSMSVDDTIEKKINEFAENKQRKKRIERARENAAQFNETYGPKTEKPQEPRHAASEGEEKTDQLDIPGFAGQGANNFIHEEPSPTQTITSLPEQAMPETDEGATMVFPGSRPPAQEEEEESAQTVVMSDQEIKNLLEEDEPLLKREYVEKGPSSGSSLRQGTPRRQREVPVETHKVSWKVPAIIVGCVLGALFIFGGYQLVSGWIQEKTSETSKAGKEASDKILDWITNTLKPLADQGNLNEDALKKITDYESFYNKLNAEQKAKINAELKTLTGKTFDELLAAAKKADKKDSSNNNTEIAQQKAKLKDQIQTLEAQKSSQAALLNTITAAEQDLNSKNQVYIDAVNTYNNTVSAIQTMQAQLNNYQPDSYYDQQISAKEAERDRLKPTEGMTPEEIEKIEQQKAELNQQIGALRAAKEQNAAERTALQNEINNSQASLSGLQSAMNSAQQELKAAQSTYDKAQVNGTAPQLQAKIAEIQAQIDSLQRQLDELDAKSSN
ncbi:MAG: hypothetical protein HUJ54_04635 [Erysipelotrichaceae bacterium]|nr:hypothetical protein [Erysipelotrichaceae bacterium]